MKGPQFFLLKRAKFDESNVLLSSLQEADACCSSGCCS